MPVILEPASENMKKWLDPGRREWTNDLQSMLKPFEGKLEVYPVSKDVGKVGNNSPSFIIPLDSKENKSNIANFFANASKQKETKSKDIKSAPFKSTTKKEEDETRDAWIKQEKADLEVNPDEIPDTKDSQGQLSGVKRKASDASQTSPLPVKQVKKAETGKISATKNRVKSPVKSQVPKGSQKITNFFTK